MVVHKKKRETVHNKKFIHLKDHFNEQVANELVFYNFFHMKKSGWLLNCSTMYISNEQKTKLLC